MATELIDALESLNQDDLTTYLTVLPGDDSAWVFPAAGGPPKKVRLSRIAGYGVKSSEEIPADTTLDITLVAEDDKGTEYTVTGVDEIDTITQEDDTTVTYTFESGGSQIDDTGNIEGVPNGTLTVTEGMKVTVFKPAGENPKIINIYSPQDPLTLASATPVALIDQDTVCVYRPQTMTVAGASTTAVNGLYIHDGRTLKRQHYLHTSGLYRIHWTTVGDDRWRIIDTGTLAQILHSVGEDVATPDLVTVWYTEAPADDTVTVTASAPGVYLLEDGTFAPSERPVTAKTSDYVVLIGDDQTIFTNTGAGGTVKFTLPANASCTAGKTGFRFVCLAAERIDVEPASGNIYGYSDGSAAAFDATNGNPVNNGSTIGEWIEVTYMGSNIWHAELNGNWA
jgi:hypothetical protein